MRRLLLVLPLLAACNESGLAGLGADIDGPSQVEFAPTATGQQDSRTVTLKNVGGGELRIASLEISGAPFGVVGADALPITLAASEELLVQVTFSPTSPDPASGTLTVVSNDLDEPELEIALVSSTLAADIDIDPSPVLSFGSQPAGVTMVKPLTVSNVGTAPLTVTGATFGVNSSPSFHLTYQFPVVVDAGSSVDLPIAFTPGSASPHGGSISIASDDPDEPVKNIGLTGEGNGTAVPDINPSPAMAAFGQVVRFTCSTIPVSIQNVGTGTLTVTSIALAPGTSTEYTFTPSAFSVNPGAAQTLNVTYCPMQIGVDNGALYINSTDPDEGVLVLPVSGEGIPPPVGNANTDIAIQVTWNTDDDDVDTHLIGPGGSFNVSPGDCYYSNLNPDWGVAGVTMDNPFLDHDDVDGFGPEDLNLGLARTGSYRVALYFYADDAPATGSDVTVKVYLNGVMSYTNTRLLLNHQRWDVVDIAWNETTDSGNMSVVDAVIQMFTLAPQTK